MNTVFWMALVAVALVIGVANYNRERGGGAIMIAKTHTAWEKDQSRLPRDGCILWTRDFICKDGK